MIVDPDDADVNGNRMIGLSIKSLAAVIVVPERMFLIGIFRRPRRMGGFRGMGAAVPEGLGMIAFGCFAPPAASWGNQPLE